MENRMSFDEIKQAFLETDRRMRETDRKLAEVGRQIGGLGNRLGEFVEGIVRPGLVRLFRDRGVVVHQTLRDLEAKRDGISAQVDLLVVNADHAVAVEVKSKLSASDVDEHLARLEKFKFLFPQYAQMRLHAAVAAMVIPEAAARYAERHGVFVIGQTGDDAVFRNSEGFEPREW